MAEAGETTGAALRERLDFIERLAEATPVILYSYDPIGHRISYANRSLAHTLGYDDHITLPGEDWVRALVHPDDLPSYQEALRSNAASGEREVVHGEFRMRRADGSYEWISNWVTVAARNAAGEPTQLVGAAAIVTGRKQAEADRLESEARLRLLADHAHDIVVRHRLHPQPATEYVSPSVEAIVGYAPGEFLEDPELQEKLLHPDDRPRWLAIMGDLVQAASSVHTLRWIARSGDTVYLELHLVPRCDESGRPVAVDVVARDVTEKALLEEQLRQAQKLEAMGALAGGVAHDYNNLLGVTLGYVSVLKQELGDNERAREAVEAVEDAARRAASLTRQLLAFAKPAAVRPELISLNDVVHDVESLLRRLLPEDVELVLRLEPGIPAVLADAGQLEQVIVNLVLNARDAMPAGGTLTLDTGFRKASSAGSVWLRVRDTGVGMDEATQSRVFEPFFTTKAHGKGTGLGLPTVYGIVTQSDGSIDVASRPGMGSSFTVRLPAREGFVPNRSSKPVPFTADLVGATVLLVEDEPALRCLVRRTLTDRGYRVIDAACASTALALAEQFQGNIDLLLTDVVMPKVSGPRLAARLAHTRPGARVLYMSGHALDEVSRHGIGADVPIIDKPFSPEELALRVSEVLRAEASERVARAVSA